MRLPSASWEIAAAGILLLLSPIGRPLSAQDDLARLLPGKDEVPGWALSSKPQTAVGDDLYSLIDGGADLFLEYGFVRALMAEYRDGASGVINVEIYRMQDAGGAYGIFSFRRGNGDRSLEAGQEAMLEEYYLNAWKGDTLITLISLDGTAKTKDALITFAKTLADRIPGPGQRPQIAQRLALSIPRPSRIVYVRGPIALSNIWPMPGRKFPPFAEGAVARSEEADYLLLAHEDEAACRRAFSSLAAILGATTGLRQLSLEPERIAFTEPRGRRTIYRRLGSLLAAVSGNPVVDLDTALQKLAGGIAASNWP